MEKFFKSDRKGLKLSIVFIVDAKSQKCTEKAGNKLLD